MLRIGICDDEKIIQDELKDMVSHIVFQYGEVEFSTFSSGQDVIKAVEEKTFTCDLLLLDIHMPDRDGIETAKYIRMHQIDVDIIFVTVSKEHVFDGYTYQAFSYLLKPIQYPRLEDELGRYIYERSKNSRCLHVNINGHKEKLLLDKVKYFEADTRKVIAHLLHGEVTFYAKLSDLQKVLESYDFLRCHQSYLVNTMFISGYSRTEISLEDITIPISRKYTESVRLQLDARKDGEYGELGK